MKFKLIPITSVKQFKYTGTIHDLTVDTDHSYNIKKMIVHNSICSTRMNCGFGVPQFTSVQDCAKVKLPHVILISDGGIKHPGDISKAIAAGADFCMLGKMLASTDLAAGQCYDKDKHIVSPYIDKVGVNTTINVHKWIAGCKINPEVRYKEYHGMASRDARKGVLQYASVEGVSGLTPFTGSTSQLLIDLKLNLEASLSYAGSRNWTDFKRHVKIIKISNSAILESSTHVEGF